MARLALDEIGHELQGLGSWIPLENLPGWRLEFDLVPADLAVSTAVPARSSWVVVVHNAYPQGDVAVYPAAVGGIEGTFPHQLPNRPPEEGSYRRAGKVCTSESVSGHPLAISMFEPQSAEKMLVWHVRRTLDWLRAASRDELLRPGEPYELPVYSMPGSKGPTIAFNEGPETFAAWTRKPARSGITLFQLMDARAPRVLAIEAFRHDRLRDAVAPVWGTSIESLDEERLGAWLRLSAQPVMLAWRAPWTWGELRECFRREGRDLDHELAPLIAQLRDGWSHNLLLGFPIPELVGGAPVIMHWLGIKVPAVNRNKKQTPRNGFRIEAGRYWDDKTNGPLKNDSPIEWVPTENWHQTQLATRGAYGPALAGRPVALIGGGALGATLGGMLVRGGVLDLSVMDEDVLGARNLVRHPLDLRAVGLIKAGALAKALNEAAPNAHVVGFDVSFPPSNPKAIAAIERAEVVLDTTGNDATLHEMAMYPWSGEKTFVSLSLSYGARRLYLFAGRGPTFPVARFLELFTPWRVSDVITPDEMKWEAFGCFNPVFPARDDDIMALAALASRQLESWLPSVGPEWELRVFARAEDGTIQRLEAPPPSAIVA